MLALISMPSCSKKVDLTDYHSQWDKWTLVHEQIRYSFEYVKTVDDGFYILITEEENSYCNEKYRLMDGLYIASNDKYEFISMDGYDIEKIDYSCGFSCIFPPSLYKISDTDVAYLYIRSKDDFHGYCKTHMKDVRNNQFEMFPYVYFDLY